MSGTQTLILRALGLAEPEDEISGFHMRVLSKVGVPFGLGFPMIRIIVY